MICVVWLCFTGTELSADVGVGYTIVEPVGEAECRTPILQVYLHFTAYSVTSRSLVMGTCVKTSGSPVTLLD